MTMRLGAAAVVAAVLAVVSAGPARALDGGVDLSVQSAYIWRGMVLNDKPVFQPSVTLSSGGFSGSIWANVNLTADYGYKGEASELDYWLAYTLETRNVDWTLTYYDYTFPHTSNLSTQEAWLSATLKNVPFTPSLTAIRDVNAIKGWYFLLTGTQSLGVLRTRASEGLALTLNVGRGTKEYCRGYYPELEQESVTDYGVRLEWPGRVGPGTLRLNAQYTSFTDSEIYTPGFEGKRANLVGGVTYSIEF